MSGSLARSGSMPRSSFSAAQQLLSALQRSSTMPNDRRGSKVSFGAALQVRQRQTWLLLLLWRILLLLCCWPDAVLCWLNDIRHSLPPTVSLSQDASSTSRILLMTDRDRFQKHMASIAS